MKEGRRKILSLIISVAILLVFMPQQAFAQAETIKHNVTFRNDSGSVQKTVQVSENKAVGIPSEFKPTENGQLITYVTNLEGDKVNPYLGVKRDETFTVHYGNKIKVKLSVVGDKKINNLPEQLVEPTEVELTAENFKYNSGQLTSADALVKAWNDGARRPTETNIEDQINGNYISKMYGLAAQHPGLPGSGWLYYINDKYVPVGLTDCQIFDGDDIRWFYVENYGNNKYTWFDRKNVEVQVNEEVNLVASYLKYDMHTNGTTTAKYEGAKVYIDGEPALKSGQQIKTDSEGKVTLTFPKAGNYLVTATDRDSNGILLMTSPYTMVKVKETTSSEKTADVFFNSEDGQKIYPDSNGVFKTNILTQGRFALENVQGYEINSQQMAPYWQCRVKMSQGINHWDDIWVRADGTLETHDVREVEARVFTKDPDYPDAELIKTFKIKNEKLDVEEVQAFIDGKRIDLDRPYPVKVGDTKQLVLKVKLVGNSKLFDVPMYSIVSESSDKTKVHTFEGGYFQVKGAGTANVTAKLADNSTQIILNLSTENAAIEDFDISYPENFEIYKWNILGGKWIGIREDGLKITYTPAHTVERELEWKSLDPDVAYYQGLYGTFIIPKKAGRARFEVTSKAKPQLTKTLTINFTYKKPLKNASISESEIRLKVGDQRKLDITVAPEDATEPRFSWQVSKPGVIDISTDFVQDPDDEYLVNANTRINGLAVGEVDVTGTPIDTTGNAKPIKFKVIVEGETTSTLVDFEEINGWAEAKCDSIEEAYKNISPNEDWWKIAELGKRKHEPSEATLEWIKKKTLTSDGELEKDVNSLTKNILALRASGIDPTNYYGHNLPLELSKLNVKAGGIWSEAPALWALASDDYGIEVNKKAEEIVKSLLSQRNENGLWGDSWQDATGFALYALAPFYDSKEEVREAVEKVINSISSKQNFNGGFADNNSNSHSMVIGGLLGCNPEYLKDSRLIKNGKTMLDGLKVYDVQGEPLLNWQVGSTVGRPMATEQGYRALVTYFEKKSGKGSVFDYRGTPKKILGALTIVSVSLDGKEKTIMQGDAFTLPTIAKATMSDGSVRDVNITWNKVPDTNQIGTQVFKGSIEKWSEKLEYTLKVKTPAPRYKINVGKGHANTINAEEGALITITTEREDFGFWVGNVTFTDRNERETTFIMPGKKVYIHPAKKHR